MTAPWPRSRYTCSARPPESPSHDEEKPVKTNNTNNLRLEINSKCAGIQPGEDVVSLNCRTLSVRSIRFGQVASPESGNKFEKKLQFEETLTYEVYVAPSVLVLLLLLALLHHSSLQFLLTPSQPLQQLAAALQLHQLPGIHKVPPLRRGT